MYRIAWKFGSEYGAFGETDSLSEAAEDFSSAQRRYGKGSHRIEERKDLAATWTEWTPNPSLKQRVEKGIDDLWEGRKRRLPATTLYLGKKDFAQASEDDSCGLEVVQVVQDYYLRVV